MSTHPLDPFYPVLPDAAWVARIAGQGAKFIQLRVKDMSPNATIAEIARSLELAAAYGFTLVVNDYWREAIDLGADFVHLGQGDLAGADLDAIRAAGVRLGISTHSYAELDTALGVAPDYIALGPIYPTKLKTMPWAPQSGWPTSSWPGIRSAAGGGSGRSRLVKRAAASQERRVASSRAAAIRRDSAATGAIRR